MKFEYKAETNIKVGQKLYGIIACSSSTYEGVYEIVVAAIYFDDGGEIVFDIDQPCGQVMASFGDMSRFVFETKEEAERQLKIVNVFDGDGLYACLA